MPLVSSILPYNYVTTLLPYLTVASLSTPLCNCNMSDSDDSECPDYALLSTDRHGDKIKIKTYERKSKCVKGYKKLKKKNHTVVMVRAGRVIDKYVHGGPRKVAFLIGTAYGKGWSDYGPLDNEGSKYQCLVDDSGEEAGSDGSDGSDADDDNYHVVKIVRGGGGIRDEEFTKRKKAEKKFDWLKRKDRSAIIVKGNRVRNYTDPEGDEWKEKQLCCLIGMSYGRGMCTDLGPLEDPGSDLHIFDSDVAGSDSD